MSKNLGCKKTQTISPNTLPQKLAQARGDAPLDFLIHDVQLLDVITSEIYTTSIAIGDDIIVGVGNEYKNASAKKTINGKGLFAAPGFIDSHLHVESSMMSPFEFERATLPLGTTTAICDPHEITNVLGSIGFEWFLRCSEMMHQNLFVQISSCIPSLPGFETAGSEFSLESMLAYKDHPSVLGLAEMMNFKGVIEGNPEVLGKISAFEDLNLDGHAPLLRSKALNAYILTGIQNCHETVSFQEGKEKLQKGLAIIIREGSVAKNIRTLAPLANEFTSPQCLLCTDDRNPYEIAQEGHINYCIKKMINEHNIPIHVAYRLASYSAAKHFGLKRLGLIAPGKKADIVLLKDLKKVSIEEVLIGGKCVSELGLQKQISKKLKQSHPPLENTMRRKPLLEQDLAFSLEKGTYNVIEIVPDEIITKHRKIFYDGTHFSEPDVLFMANIERYGHNSKPAFALVKGTGLKSGALASSVAHDSHNLLVLGTNPQDMVKAVNTLIENGGGFVVTNHNQIKALVELPIAGLLSLKTAEELKHDIELLKLAFTAQGVTLHEPFIQIAFLALPVIPALKLTDKGLIDVNTLKFIPLKEP